MHAIIYFQHLDLAAMLRHLEKFPPNALHLCQKKKEKKHSQKIYGAQDPLFKISLLRMEQHKILE